MTCGPLCDHTSGTRTYEGNWGARTRRFCPESDLPTVRERTATGRDIVLHGGPELPTLAFEVQS